MSGWVGAALIFAVCLGAVLLCAWFDRLDERKSVAYRKFEAWVVGPPRVIAGERVRVLNPPPYNQEEE